MPHHVGYYLGLSKQSEVLVLAVVGIVCTIFDASLLDLDSNMQKVWKASMDPAKFTDAAEMYIKYAISGVVLVRTFTVHLYLGCYIILLYPATFEEKPSLILPWLFTNCLKSLLAGFVSFGVGMYTCVTYHFLKPSCFEFFLTQILDHAPSVYMFFLVISYYRDLKEKDRIDTIMEKHGSRPRAAIRQLGIRRRCTVNKNELPNFLADDFSMTNAKRQLLSCSFIESRLKRLGNYNSGVEDNDPRTRSLDSMLKDLQADEERRQIFEAASSTEIACCPYEKSSQDDLDNMTNSASTTVFASEIKIAKINEDNAKLNEGETVKEDNGSANFNAGVAKINEHVVAKVNEDVAKVNEDMTNVTGDLNEAEPKISEDITNVNENNNEGYVDDVKINEDNDLAYDDEELTIVYAEVRVPTESEIRNVLPDEDINRVLREVQDVATDIEDFGLKIPKMGDCKSSIDERAKNKLLRMALPSRADFGQQSDDIYKGFDRKTLIDRMTTSSFEILLDSKMLDTSEDLDSFYRDMLVYRSAYTDDGYTQALLKKKTSVFDYSNCTED